ncbi:MAG TPA: hypothetical protein VGB25_05775 [Candidatus Binatia bacterium]
MRLLAVVSSAVLTLGLLTARGYGASYFDGKTVTVVQGRTPAGTGDVRARVVIEYLQKYLGTNVTIVSRYVPGGGGNQAANYMAQKAKRNGLTIGNVGSSMFPNAILGARGVRYNLEDFVFLGSASPGNPYTLVIRPGLKLDTVEKVKDYQGLRFAQRSVGHAMYILDRIVAYTLDLKDPKWILGYSSSEIPIALEKGEADAESQSIPGIMRETPHWLNEFGFPVTIKNAVGQGAEAVPGFPQGLPSLEQYADTKLKQEVLQFNNAIRPTAAPYFVPKGLPPEVLKELKEAFGKIWKDPKFSAAYKKATAGEDAVPMTGEEIERILASRPKNPEVRDLYQQLIGAGPLPAKK